MSLALKLNGTLTITPDQSATPSKSDDGPDPYGLALLTQNAEPALENSQRRAQVESPAAYVALPISANLRGRVFFLRLRGTTTPIDIRLTLATTGAVVIPQVRGMVLMEFDEAEQISAVEVQGTATFDWVLTGVKV